MTSNSLLDLVRARDEVAWRTLTQLYAPLIYHWCRRAGLGAEDSADIVQEVFRSVAVHIAAFEKTETSGSFRGWLWSITRNKIRDHFKVHASRPRAAGGTDAQMRLLEHPDAEDVEEIGSDMAALDALTYRALQIIRGEVKESTWQAFWRSTVDDVGPAAVAAELGISVESVWQAKSRVLRRLRQLLN